MIDAVLRRVSSSLRERVGNRALGVAGFLRLAGEARLLRPDGAWSCARVLHERAQTTPQAELLWFEGRWFSCAEMAAEANRWTRLFRARGVGQGDCVALLLDNGPTLLAALAGLNRLGAEAALLNPALPAPGLAGSLAAVSVIAVVVDRRLTLTLTDALGQATLSLDPAVWITGAEDGPPTELDERRNALANTPPSALPWPRSAATMCYVYTSGTSGRPKAAIISNLRWLTGAAFMGRSLAEAGPGDVIYCALPLCHNTAQAGGWATALVTGASLALRRRFSASECLADVRTTGATIFLYIGELCRYWLAQPPTDLDREHRLRVAVGVGLRAALWTEFQARFGIPRVREMYGATEGNVAIANYEGRPGMLGQLGRGQCLVACDVETGAPIRDASGRCELLRAPGQVGLLLGEVTRAKNFDGYRDRAANRAKLLRDVLRPGDRWFNSGDLLRLHEHGWVSFVDRLGDSFRFKGENVSTTEVAAIVEGAPGVTEAVVYGVEFPGSEGRAGMACVVSEPGDELDLAALAVHLDRNLAPFQRPLVVRVTDAIRTTDTHKQLTRLYRRDGWDPERSDDPLWIRSGLAWLRLDRELAAALARDGLAALSQTPRSTHA